MNFTWFASAYDTDDVQYRLLTFVQIAGVLVVAAGVPAAFNEQDFTTMVVGYIDHADRARRAMAAGRTRGSRPVVPSLFGSRSASR